MFFSTEGIALRGRGMTDSFDFGDFDDAELAEPAVAADELRSGGEVPEGAMLPRGLELEVFPRIEVSADLLRGFVVPAVSRGEGEL